MKKLIILFIIFIFTSCNKEGTNNYSIFPRSGDFFTNTVECFIDTDEPENYFEWKINNVSYGYGYSKKINDLNEGEYNVILEKNGEVLAKRNIYVLKNKLDILKEDFSLAETIPLPPVALNGNNFAGINIPVPENFDLSGKTTFQIKDAQLLMWYSYSVYLNKDDFKKFWIEKGYDVWFYSDWFYSGDIGVVSNNYQTVVVFRGSQQIRDWLLNFDFMLGDVSNYNLYGKIHNGQKKAIFFTLWEHLYFYLKNDILSKKPIYVTGHSLGGGMAATTAKKLYKEGANLKSVYLFANVKSGDIEFSKNYNELLADRTFSIINEEDIVPHLPPANYSEKAFKEAFPWYLNGFISFILKFIDYDFIGENYYLFDKDGKITGPFKYSQDWSNNYWKKIKKRGGILNSKNRVIFENHLPDYYLNSLLKQK